RWPRRECGTYERAAARAHRPRGNGRAPGCRSLQGDSRRRSIHQQIGADARLGPQAHARPNRQTCGPPACAVLWRTTMRSPVQKMLALATALSLLGLAAQVQAELRQFEMTIEEMEIDVAPGFKSKVWGFN